MDLDAEIDSMSVNALRAMRGKHIQQLVCIVFDEVVEFDNFKVEADGELVGDVRSQVWSPRYNKYLTMVMMKRDFLADNRSITIDNKQGAIVDLPFNFDAIV
jgi:hypothetical protein